ncbi:glycosyltransferase family 4 protein (plasmid) [Pseudanabaena biceps]|nr:glycosyltransferase family 4 protein [Pseudanabaena biceps]
MALKVLVFSRNYPNNVTPILGLWVEHLVRQLARVCEIKVISPVPYCPPLPSFIPYTKYRHIPLKQIVNGIEVFYPRFLVGMGYSLHRFESYMYFLGVQKLVQQIQQKFPFDLIHAHCIYPDGIVATKLGDRYKVPVVVTEHAFWHPWLDDYPSVRRQAIMAASKCAAHVLASRSLQDSVMHFTGQSKRTHSIPIGVDVSLFALPSSESLRQADQILYVGQIKDSKGIGSLLKAMHRLLEVYPDAELVIAGGSLWGYQAPEEIRLRSLAHSLGLQHKVRFLGPKTPAEVATLMQTSALLVLPSLRETFGAVLVEALACGTPVVATRCGGPEDIVNESVGLLVPQEDEKALVEAIAHILQHRDQYQPERLRSYAVQHYSWEKVTEQTVDLYQKVLAFS